MDALDNMRTRLRYNGGEQQQSRMIEDKLRSLKKALLYSYQAGTMIIENPGYVENSTDRLKKLPTLEFRCLMNPDKLTFDADKKMLSVPFEDVCLNAERAGKTSDGIVPVPISCGDTFVWKETDSRWLVTLRYLEELAYFRADVRKCYPFPLEIDGNKYYFYVDVISYYHKVKNTYKKNEDAYYSKISGLYTYSHVPVLEKKQVGNDLWYKVPVSLTSNENVYGYTLSKYSSYIKIELSSPIVENILRTLFH